MSHCRNIIYENNFSNKASVGTGCVCLPHSGSVIKHQTFILNVAAATEKLQGREFPRRKYYVMRCERHKCKNSIFQNAKKVNFPQFYAGNAVVSGGDMSISLTFK